MKFIIVYTCLFFTVIAASSGSNTRIINGNNAVDGQFPYMVSLGGDGFHGCGGSILDEYTILCVAHCVYQNDAKMMRVTLGNVAFSEQTQVHEVASYIYHPDYNLSTSTISAINDISLIKLKTPIVFRNGVRPIKLRQTDIGEEEVVLSGWGSTTDPGDPTDKLQYYNLKTLTTKQCQSRITGPEIIDSEICAFSQQGQGACRGDSGSPLVDLNGEQVGIASWVVFPCASGYPDVFTRIYSLLEWIEKNRN